MTIKQRYAFFYGEFENEKKKGQKILTFWSGDLNPRFSVIFPPMIWNFMEMRSPRSNQNKLLKYIGLYTSVYVPSQVLKAAGAHEYESHFYQLAL